jgi:NADPH-dependent 2,4-dienoyl-CoA reductase/sulfur reductase-like enzyme
MSARSLPLPVADGELMTTLRVHTCIVGGGPAGLMLGLLLAKRGADVLVLRRARELRSRIQR